MLLDVAKKIFGSGNERELKRLRPLVRKIASYEPELQKLSLEALAGKTVEFRERLGKGETLNDILPEAFAVVREASTRILKMRHFDVQMLGGIVLHQGKVAEMKTGEGKTLVATLPVYLNALSGKGAHVVTVNDYLARRDAEWMGQVYQALGLTVGVIVHGLDDSQRKEAYAADITYGTNNEFGFDYLRDNMKFRLEDFVQRPLNFCIVDEVDSILIDEARTPLIISGPTDENTDKYYTINAIIPKLKRRMEDTHKYKQFNNIISKLKKGDDYYIQTQRVKFSENGKSRLGTLLSEIGLSMKQAGEFVEKCLAKVPFEYDKKEAIEKLVGSLKNKEDYTLEDIAETLRQPQLTKGGEEKAREAAKEMEIKTSQQSVIPHTEAALKANLILKKGTHYSAEVRRVQRLGEFDFSQAEVEHGRHDYRLPDGLQQAVEAKENAEFSPGEDEDFTIDEKARSSTLTETGVEKVQRLLRVNNLYAPENMDLVHHVNQALKAHAIFKRDVDYVVKEGQVIIVDEFTGRLMPGRRYSDGLHQALEAKEGVTIENENQTLATITFQNYFRMYNKLSGMTGTAETEAPEFHKIYSLDVVVIPTNKPMVRNDEQDMVYKNRRAKFNAVCDEIEELNEKGVPVLVGTNSIEQSEVVSKFLKGRGISHNVLNAKHHESEAQIVASAGQPGMVTIATNMAGRGTDIVLGEGVSAKGGLHIIGTERNESRRVDNQLRGRAGRQGDPGFSRFYLSLEDDLLRIFQGDKIKAYMDRFKMEEEVPIESKLITRAIENAQKKVESHNFDIRKHLLEYDDVLNKQREVIYELRKLILGGESTRTLVIDIVHEQIDGLLETYASTPLSSEWDTEAIVQGLQGLFDSDLGATEELFKKIGNTDELAESLYKQAEQLYAEREKQMTPEIMRQLEEWVYLGTIDHLWKDHLLNMDHLKEGVGLRGYGQKDPLVEYKKEGFALFKMMDDQVKTDVISKLYRVQVSRQEQVEDLQPKEQEMNFSRGDEEAAPQQPVVRKDKRVGRNDPCPCGSGKKYKKCHGR